jgi:hypothetical protein
MPCAYLNEPLNDPASPAYRSGSQGQHGPANPGSPQPQGRDILSEFGPERRR